MQGQYAYEPLLVMYQGSRTWPTFIFLCENGIESGKLKTILNKSHMTTA